MRREKKIEIRVCKTKDNRFTVDDFAALADERTRIIVMSTLEWCNGWASDMKAIGDFCQEKGIFLVVDAVQQLGVTKIDTKQCHFDLLVAGGHKWLNSPYGTGVLYVNKNSLSKIKQSYAGYLNTTVPEAAGRYWENPAAPSVHDWTFPETARKYEIGGTSNYTGAIAWGRAWAWSTRSASRTSRNTSGAQRYCMDQLEAIGATIITHRDPGRRGGIVIARLYDDLDVDRWVLKQLHARKIFIAQRFTDYVALPHLLPVLQQPRRHRRHAAPEAKPVRTPASPSRPCPAPVRRWHSPSCPEEWFGNITDRINCLLGRTGGNQHLQPSYPSHRHTLSKYSLKESQAPAFFPLRYRRMQDSLQQDRLLRIHNAPRFLDYPGQWGSRTYWCSLQEK